MTILQIISSSARGGAEHHVLHLSKLLKEKNHEIYVICPKGWLADQLKKLNIPVYIWNQKPPLLLKDYQFVKEVIGQKFDIVHAHLARATYIGTYIACKYKIPLVTTLHVNSIDPVCRLVAWLKHSIISISQHNHQLLLNKKISPKYIKLIPLCVMREIKNDFNKNEFIRKNDLPSCAYLILMAANIKPVKGHDLAIESFLKLKNIRPNIHLIFAGTGDIQMVENLQEKAKLLKIENNISFVGFQKNTLEWMQAADLLWIPSLTENCCLAAIESLSCGTPIVAANVGGLPEIIQNNKAGYVVSREPNQFAEATSKLINNPVLYQSMCYQAVQYVNEKFSAAKMIDNIETLYKSKIL